MFVEGDPLADHEEEDNVIGYEDIGGMQKHLDLLKEMIDLPLVHPILFDTLGIRAPRGILLTGPPGSGKTMLARAVESETGVYFKTLNGPEVMSKRSGESEAGLRKVFEEAEENSPAIIFIDEIDAIAPKRDKTQGEVERRIVSQLLTLMDGLKPQNHVIVIGATNRPNVLDPALRRFGRFDRELDLGIPDGIGRLEILQVKTKKMRLSAEVDLLQISDDTHGYTGADLAQLVTEAAMQCVRERAGTIDVDADDVDQDTLDSMVIKTDHFNFAMSKTAPSSLRDKAVEIPDCSWEDVGGLEVRSPARPPASPRPPARPPAPPRLAASTTHAARASLPLAGREARDGRDARVPDEVREQVQAVRDGVVEGDAALRAVGLRQDARREGDRQRGQVELHLGQGPELLSMWFGESEQNVRELFNKARGAAPCILFFDEIDSIAKPRGSSQSGGGEAGDRIVNQILTEVDGVGSKGSVFIIAATNRPDMLDPALSRPGRLDQLVYLPLPDFDSRLAIFKAATRKSPLAADVDLAALAEATDGCSGADITEVCQRACKLAIRQHISDTTSEAATVCDKIAKAHFDNAMAKMRKSVSPADVKKFERFREQQKANKG